MDSIKYYSKESLEQLKEELKQLETVERPKISAAIAEARDKGDLSENAEYDAAKEAQGLLELKIAKLKNIVANARILDESKIDVSKILIYSKVQVKNLQNNSVMSYTLVPESESDLKTAKISVTSPIAKALIGKQKGDVVEVKVPVGIIKLEIMDVSR
ncbi:MAG: transcription elongation factor GreA [Bacteroidales bacterium]|nr:transcription elongation factor GreA [Bacteroidales bacterium]